MIIEVSEDGDRVRWSHDDVGRVGHSTITWQAADIDELIEAYEAQKEREDQHD